MTLIKYSIANQFSRKPGPRYKEQGKNSGQEFLEDILLGIFDNAVNSGQILQINLDYTYGYGPSFLEESFGGLSRRRDKEIILKTLQFISTEEPYLIDEIKQYINGAKQLQLV